MKNLSKAEIKAIAYHEIYEYRRENELSTDTKLIK